MWSDPAEGSCVPMWDTVTLRTVSSVVCPCGRQLSCWGCPVYPRGRQFLYWGVLCAHMGDSYPCEGGLHMHTRHSLIVILLLLQCGWIIFLSNWKLFVLAEDVTEERDSNFSPHSKTGSQGRHISIRCGSQTEVSSGFCHNFILRKSRYIPPSCWCTWKGWPFGLYGFLGCNAPLSGQLVPPSPFMIGGPDGKERDCLWLSSETVGWKLALGLGPEPIIGSKARKSENSGAELSSPGTFWGTPLSFCLVIYLKRDSVLGDEAVPWPSVPPLKSNRPKALPPSV